VADRPGSTAVLLLDYNGVVVNDEPIHCASLRDTLAPEGIVVDDASYYADFLGYDDRACIREAFRRAGRPLEPPALLRLAADKARRYAERVRGGVPLVPGVREFVRVASEVARIAVVSGALRREIAGGLGQAGIAEWVGCIVSAEDVAHLKPDPEGHRLALTRVAGGRAAARTIVVEDSRPGLAAARALGAGCVMLTTTYGASEAAGADLVWESFDRHAPDELTPFMREVAIAGRV
jgi:HAD superfamily hydrolase (TIGR01509 family)